MGLPTPASIWRILKDVDLEGIRQASRRPVGLLLASEDGRDAVAFAEWLTAAPPAVHGSTHPWLRCIAAHDGMPALDAAPACAVLVSPHPDFPAALAALRSHLVRHQVPVVSVILGDANRLSSVKQAGEWSRAAVVALDDQADAPVAAALVGALDREFQMAAAREFPRLRRTVSAGIIEETAKANAAYAFTTGLAEAVPVLSAPVALGDMVILTKNQLVMSYRILLAHGRDGEPRTLLGEVVGVLGSGFLFRQAARQLVGLIPVLGLLPKVAVAYAGTWAVGKAMTAWASEGRDVTGQALKRYSREGLARGKVVARAMYDKSHAGAERVSTGVRGWRRGAAVASTPEPE